MLSPYNYSLTFVFNQKMGSLFWLLRNVARFDYEGLKFRYLLRVAKNWSCRCKGFEKPELPTLTISKFVQPFRDALSGERIYS